MTDEVRPTPDTSKELREVFEQFNRVLDEQRARDNSNPLYDRLPAAYEAKARLKMRYDGMKILEAANLLAGCVPERPTHLTEQPQLNRLIKQLADLISNCLGVSLKCIERPGLLKSERLVDSSSLIAWAVDRRIGIPESLLKIAREIRGFDVNGRAAPVERGVTVQSMLEQYSTPDLVALIWAWEHIAIKKELGSRPTPETVIETIVTEFGGGAKRADGGITKESAKRIDKMLREPKYRLGGLYSLKSTDE